MEDATLTNAEGERNCIKRNSNTEMDLENSKITDNGTAVTTEMENTCNSELLDEDVRSTSNFHETKSNSSSEIVDKKSYDSDVVSDEIDNNKSLDECRSHSKPDMLDDHLYGLSIQAETNTITAENVMSNDIFTDNQLVAKVDSNEPISSLESNPISVHHEEKDIVNEHLSLNQNVDIPASEGLSTTMTTKSNTSNSNSKEKSSNLNQEMQDMMQKNLEKFSPKKQAKHIAMNKEKVEDQESSTSIHGERPQRINPFNQVEKKSSGVWQMHQSNDLAKNALTLQSSLPNDHHEIASSDAHDFQLSEENFSLPGEYNDQFKDKSADFCNPADVQFDLMPPACKVRPVIDESRFGSEDIDAVVKEVREQMKPVADPWVKLEDSENTSSSTPSSHSTNSLSDHQHTNIEPNSQLSKDPIKTKPQQPASLIRPLIEAAGPCESEDLIEGIIFTAFYLGSTQLQSEKNPGKNARMMQAQEAVSRIKAPEGESQPSVEVDLFISTDKVKILNADTQETIMDHTLRSISYIADIGKLLVIMAKRRSPPSENQEQQQIMRDPKPQRSFRIICHVFSSLDAHLMAQAIGQAFNVAYQQFLSANGIEPQTLTRDDYNQLLDMQEMYHDDLVHYSKRENIKNIWVEKNKSESLGVVIVESGWGSIVPTVILANLQQGGPAERCGKLSIGDQIMTVNGTSLVGLPLTTCQSIIKGLRAQTIARLNIVSCPPVVTVLIKRPDLKYQLGFSVQDGIICSLMRGGIAERGGVRVGHRIIEINSQSVVATPHEKIVQTLVSSVGEIQMKTMPAMMYRLLTGQEQPVYI